MADRRLRPRQRPSSLSRTERPVPLARTRYGQRSITPESTRRLRRRLELVPDLPTEYMTRHPEPTAPLLYDDGEDDGEYEDFEDAGEDENADNGLMAVDAALPASRTPGGVKLPPPVSGIALGTTQEGRMQAEAARQETSGHTAVPVFLRVRPPVPTDTNTVSPLEVVDSTTVRLRSNLPAVLGKAIDRIKGAHQHSYKFTGVFAPEITQRQVFEMVALPLVKECLAGKKTLVFAYGVTGSGKTFTVQGPPNDVGLMPRVIDTIFASLETQQSSALLMPVDLNRVEAYRPAEAAVKEGRHLLQPTTATLKRAKYEDLSHYYEVPDVGERTVLPVPQDGLYSVWISAAEIYCGKPRDLFLDSTKPANKLTFNMNTGIITGLISVRVKTLEEAVRLFARAQRSRTQSETDANAHSSRSHAIFTIKIVKVPLIDDRVFEDPKLATVSAMTIVDLAGAERTSTTSNKTKKEETAAINQSLSNLEHCLMALQKRAQGATLEPPYRNDNLTMLFRPYFEGHGQAVMIINVNPFGRYEHVKRVMDFSNTAMAIRIRQQAVRKLPPPQDWGAGRKRSPPRKKSPPREPAPEPDSAIVEDDTDPAAYLVFPGDGADWDGDEMGLLERVRHLRQAKEEAERLYAESEEVCAQLYDDVDRLQAQVQQLQEELRQAHMAKAQVSERMQQQLRNLEEMNRQERMAILTNRSRDNGLPVSSTPRAPPRLHEPDFQRMHELQERLLSQSQTITALQAQIESQQSAIQDHIVYQAKLEEQITAYRHRLEEAQAEKRALEQTIDQLEADNADLVQQKKDAVREARAIMTAEMEEMVNRSAENEVARASKLLAQFESDKAQFNATIKQLTAEVETLRSDIAAKDRENERLQDALVAIRGGGSADPGTRRSGGSASGKRHSGNAASKASKAPAGKTVKNGPAGEPVILKPDAITDLIPAMAEQRRQLPSGSRVVPKLTERELRSKSRLEMEVASPRADGSHQLEVHKLRIHPSASGGIQARLEEVVETTTRPYATRARK